MTGVQTCALPISAEGAGSKDVAGKLRLHPFYAEKLYRQSEAFSQEELRGALVRLAELDGALKGQSKLGPDLEVQRALVDLSARPGAKPT